ncbi:MAG: sensor histidine kinase [Saprospiraceae bacterium]|nr:sensor histidine kinase [Saprospiraceae bacterium]
MIKKQTLLLYGIILFMDLFGLELMASPFWLPGNMFSIFKISNLIYALITMELTRRAFEKFYPSNKILQLVGSLVAVLAFFIMFRYLLEEAIFPLIFGHGNYVEGTTLNYYIRDNYLYAVRYITLGFLVFLFENNWNSKQKIWELNLQKKEAELKYLRSQMNPHFLFNTLNNVFTLVYEKSDDAPEAYLKMTELTRYMLYEKADLVPIEDEIKHLKNYLSLQALRFKAPVQLKLDIKLEKGEALIPPYLLITLAENIFKHGEVSNTDEPASLTIEESSTVLKISTSNLVKKAQKDKVGGVGLENIVTRLQLLYPENHTFTKSSNADRFEIAISLFLQKKRI